MLKCGNASWEKFEELWRGQLVNTTLQPRDTRHCKHQLVVLLRTNYVEQRSYNSLWLETEPPDISIINEKHIMNMDYRCKKMLLVFTTVRVCTHQKILENVT